MRLIMELADRANPYIDAKKPWVLAKQPTLVPVVGARTGRRGHRGWRGRLDAIASEAQPAPAQVTRYRDRLGGP